jgi:BirA family transcriptional regulator, biotin operon repressor / biotin---[acetyl-CoA-carboxylase] ligase
MTEVDLQREILFHDKIKNQALSVLKKLTPHFLISVDSTQDYLSQVLKSENEGDFVVSRIQTMGRGRQGRTWISDYGGLYLSITLTPKRPAYLSMIAEMIASSICNAFGRNLDLHCEFSPPNDVLCNGKKIAGILVDASIAGNKSVAHVGIGVNLNNGSEWDDEVEKVATSYYMQKREKISLDDFLLSLLKTIDEHYLTLNS